MQSVRTLNVYVWSPKLHNLHFLAHTCTCISLTNIRGWKYCIKLSQLCIAHVLPSCSALGKETGEGGLERKGTAGLSALPSFCVIISSRSDYYRAVAEWARLGQDYPWPFPFLRNHCLLSSFEARSGFGGKCGLQGPPVTPPPLAHRHHVLACTQVESWRTPMHRGSTWTLYSRDTTNTVCDWGDRGPWACLPCLYSLHKSMPVVSLGFTYKTQV